MTAAVSTAEFCHGSRVSPGLYRLWSEEDTSRVAFLENVGVGGYRLSFEPALPEGADVLLDDEPIVASPNGDYALTEEQGDEILIGARTLSVS